jgi:uncharacterized protein (UPF0333 family)
MKRTEFKTILLGIVLAVCGAGLYFIGTRVGSKSVPDESLLFSDGLIDGWTLWHYIGSLLVFFAVAVMLGATMAWLRRKNAKSDSQSILSGLS